MSADDEMTIDERFKYLRKMKKRYINAGRKERGHLLNEMEAITGLHRKSLIRLINGNLKRRPRRRQRGRTYGPEVDDALRVIAESMDFICAERLTPNLTWLAKCLAGHSELTVSPPLLEQLDRISVSTVERILARIRQDVPRLPRNRPRPANRATRDIPMRRIPWNEQEPGHFEADLVHHCGLSASGEYVSTVQLVDVATGWSERAAVLGRSYLVMEDAFQRILARLPFPILEIHPDNGSEFFNHHMLRFWNKTIPGVQLSRSRPYHKKDNRFVEQKNSSLVRSYLGRDRLDSVAQTRALNHLYNRMWMYYNFFQPVMRLTEKTWLPKDGEATRVKRRYDQARTPFDRLCATNAISQEQKEQLQALRVEVNPRQLCREIHDLIDYIFSLPGAVPGTTESVRRTLMSHACTGQDQRSLISTYMEQKPKTLERKERTSPVTLSFDRTIPVR
jgi:hypothetical protein